MSQLEIQTVNSELVVDSRLIAATLSLSHKAVKQTIRRYELQLLKLGPVALEVAMGESLPQGGFSQGETFYYLNERQANFLMSLSRNTPEVVEAKLNLVQAFDQAKQALLSTHQPSLQPEAIDNTSKFLDQAPGFKKMLEGLGCEQGLATQITFKLVADAAPHLIPGLRLASKHMGIAQAVEEDYLTPTQIADRLSELTEEKYSAQSVNSRLALKGLQIKEKKEWRLTQAGDKYGVRKPFTSPNSNYSSWQILWKESVIRELLDIAA